MPMDGGNLSANVSVKSFDGNCLMVLFNLGWSRLINKLSLIRRLNLFASQDRISKWSECVEQLHSGR